MKAIHFTEGGGPVDSLVLQEIEKPVPGPHDLLVEIKACSVNPVDTKIRKGAFPASDITGFDASGTVESVGAEVGNFEAGDEVFYAGALGRPGSTAAFNLVDARVAAKRPRSVSWAEAAAYPLVSLTAWEMLVDHFNLVPYGVMDTMANKSNPESILIVNGAGGVGSIATQLAAKVFKLKHVIVTASRQETIEHAKQMGATHVINHHEELQPQLERLGIKECKYIFLCHDTATYLPVACKIAATWGKVGSIVETEEPLQFQSMDAFSKALSFHWEFMMAKPIAGIMMESQGRILKQIAKLVDAKTLSSIVTETMPLTVQNLRKAHEKLESGKAIGKIALEVGDIE